MIRATCKDNASLAGFLKISQNLLALCLHVRSRICKLFPAKAGSFHDFFYGKLLKFLYQSLGYGFQIPEGKKGVAQDDFSSADFLYVIFDILGVRGNDRTVIMVVCFVKFISLIKQCRVEDEVYLLVDQPAYVSVSQLGRVTLGFTGNGFNAKFIDPAVG